MLVFRGILRMYQMNDPLRSTQITFTLKSSFQYFCLLLSRLTDKSAMRKSFLLKECFVKHPDL